MKCAVITASTGEPSLVEALQSVQAQTHPPDVHVIVADGAASEAGVRDCIAQVDTSRVRVVFQTMQEATGEGGFYGHRIYAASPYLFPDYDVFCFLDADNMFDPEHIGSMIAALTDGDADFAYSLRRVVTADGALWCNDDCDSLGAWPRFDTHYIGQGILPPDNEEFLNSCAYLIDTSSYAVRRRTLVTNSHLWDHGYGADCVFAQHLMTHARGVCTGRRTLSYRLDVVEQPGVADYFRNGNELIAGLVDTLPWVTIDDESYIELPELDPDLWRRAPNAP